MSVCLCYESAAAEACARWRGPDGTPLSVLHEAPLGKHCQRTETPHCQDNSSPKWAVPTPAEPPTLGSPRSKKGQTITNIFSFRLSWGKEHCVCWRMCTYVCVCVVSAIFPQLTDLLHITEGVNRAPSRFILKAADPVRGYSKPGLCLRKHIGICDPFTSLQVQS